MDRDGSGDGGDTEKEKVEHRNCEGEMGKIRGGVYLEMREGEKH